MIDTSVIELLNVNCQIGDIWKTDLLKRDNQT